MFIGVQSFKRAMWRRGLHARPGGRSQNALIGCWLALATTLALPGHAQEPKTELAKETRNPVADLISQPSFAPGQTRQNGIGDTTLSVFASPKAPGFGRILWGAGPVVTGALVNNVWNLERADHHGRLGGGRERLARAGRWGNRQGPVHRTAAGQHQIPGLLQSRETEVRPDWSTRFQIQLLFPK